LCPRAYLRVPDHGDPHLLPCCGYLPWRSRGLNTDSWRPSWGDRHDHWANSKDIHRLDQRTRRREELVACKSTTCRVLASTFNMLNAIEIHDGFDPDAVSRWNLKESTPVLSLKKASSPKQIPVHNQVPGSRPAVAELRQNINRMHAREDYCCKLLLAHRESYQRISRTICLDHTEGVHVSRLLVTRPHRLYVSLAVRREYSSPDHSGSTSPMPYAAATSSSGRTTTSTTHLDK
jgi:hypothetical protein